MSTNPTKSQRRRPLFRVEAEILESRQLLTGGAGNTFALTQGNVAAAGGSTVSAFVIESTHFTAPKGKITLGVDVVATAGSTLNPQIADVSAGSGKRVRVERALKGAAANSTSADLPHAVLATIRVPRGKAAFAAGFRTNVAAQAKTSGDFLLGYYLPGDANGDGRVTPADLTLIKKGMGKDVNADDYPFDADSNRDGVISRSDLMLAKRNLGVATTITPDFTANLDPATDTGASDRITNTQTVTFTGAAAPGAAISYQEVNGKAPTTSTVAAPTGQYTVSIPLTEGTSTFMVSSVDAFGQTITGSIQPVTYTTGDVPTDTATTST